MRGAEGRPQTGWAPEQPKSKTEASGALRV